MTSGQPAAGFSPTCLTVNGLVLPPARATRAHIKALFDHFVATFAVQMVLMLAVFGNYGQLTRAKGPVSFGWLALWCVYLLGLLAKATERPRADERWSFHEVLHGFILLGNALGMALDVADLSTALPAAAGVEWGLPRLASLLGGAVRF